jgi:acyl-CoA synthetase (AMP-forming)/AMP-acid ligase II
MYSNRLLLSIKAVRPVWSRLATATGRCSSNFIVKPLVQMPELSSSLVNTPLPTFVMKEFLHEKRANLAAIVDGFSGKELTFGDLHYHIHSMADSLRDLGVKKNDVVAIISPNHLHYATAFLGIALCGGVSTNANPLYSEKEILHQLQTTGSKVIFVHPLCLERVLLVVDSTYKVIVIDEGTHVDVHHCRQQGLYLMSELTSNARKAPKYDHTLEITKDFDPNAVVTLPFSSGTTGKSKGVMLTHKNLVSNVLQVYPLEGKFLANPKKAERGSLLCPLPLFHIYGLTAGMLVSTYLGTKLVLMPSFDLAKFLEIIQTYKITRGFVVPPIVLALAKHPIVDQYDLSSLECLMSGAAPLGIDVQVAASKRLNCIVKQAWGMTETSPCGTITPDDMIESIEALNGTSGILAPETEGKIVHPETGVDLPPTEIGELMVRGPQIMKGYLNEPDSTAKTLRADGWMHTGDIGRFDEKGWLYLTDRMKELIKYKGFQVPPAELEALIASMPEVKDVIVIPVPDEEAGEVPRAYVVKQDHCPKDFSVEDVIEFVFENVAPHKRLRGGVFFTDMIPKSPSGKLLRRVQIDIDRQIHNRFDHTIR